MLIDGEAVEAQPAGHQGLQWFGLDDHGVAGPLHGGAQIPGAVRGVAVGVDRFVVFGEYLLRDGGIAVVRPGCQTSGFEIRWWQTIPTLPSVL